MMRVRLYTVAFFIIALSSLGCSKFLETPVQNNVTVDDIFKDFEGARLTVVEMYNSLRGVNYYMRDMYLYADVTGGNIKFSRTSGAVLLQTYNFQNDAGSTDLRNLYTQAYKLIYSANNVLENIGRASNATVQQRNRLVADAYVFRALTHFDLVRIFAQPYTFSNNGAHPGIVLRLRNASVTEPIPDRNTVNEVYAAVLADLDSAIARYANSVNVYVSSSEKIFFSANYANALKARVNLYKEDNAAAVANASSVISNTQYALTTNANYVNSWRGTTNMTESIFEIDCSNIIGTGIGNFFNPFVPSNLNLQMAATTDITNLFQSGDVRGVNTLFTNPVNGFIYTRKYQGTADSINNIKLMRLSELYLTRAEAQVKQGNITAALADLNIIRLRANPSAVPFSSANLADVLAAILLERRRELCFEGHLFFDIARNKQNLVRTDCASPTCSFSFPNSNFASPIPIVN